MPVLATGKAARAAALVHVLLASAIFFFNGGGGGGGEGWRPGGGPLCLYPISPYYIIPDPRSPPSAAPPFAFALFAFCAEPTGCGKREAGSGKAKRDQLRDQRGQRRRYWPPFAPWVR
jgi:hypothetical protein